MKLFITLVGALAIVAVFLLASTEEKITETEAVNDSFKVALFENVEVGPIGSALLQPSGTQDKTKVFNGVEFTLTPLPNPAIAGQETSLTFNLKIDGRPATDMETYMGVYGLGAAIHKETLEVAPVSIVKKVTPHGTLEFRATFPSKGEYLVITQFKRAGEIITTSFSISAI